MILKTPPIFTNYGVSPCGKIKNRITGRILKPIKRKDGYLVVGFSQDGVFKTKRINRLVASLYIPNPNNLPEVNHLDLDKENNHKNNLEWSTGKNNSIHAAANGHVGGRPERPVCKISKGRKVLATYDSVCKAANENGLSFSNIYAVCRGKRKTTGGYFWQFA